MQENIKDKTMTVSQLTGLIKGLLENSFREVTVTGEISNYRPNASGHLYFALKDSNAQLSAVMYKGKALSLNFLPKDGTLVNARGYISVYPPHGKYQLVINEMNVAGAGSIMEMILKRKEKLQKEGLFDPVRKRKLPFFPHTVGIVTSPTGAALRDIINIATRRNNKVSLTVIPSLVQGDSAASTIVHAIEIANKYNLCDILIVGRGGGSLEDLLPFSEENVVRAIASSKIPVVSAVGHEIDFSLADFAADVRAPTPSAAAEICIPLLSDFTNSINNSKTILINTINNRINTLRLMIKQFTPENMEMKFRSIELPYTMRFDNACEALKENIKKRLEDTKRLVKEKEQIIMACSPQTIFDRGYSMVTDAISGKIIRSKDDVLSGSEINIRPASGLIKAKVI